MATVKRAPLLVRDLAAFGNIAAIFGPIWPMYDACRAH